MLQLVDPGDLLASGDNNFRDQNAASRTELLFDQVIHPHVGDFGEIALLLFQDALQADARNRL
ncbi:hypothetical protein D3C76_1621260 [compost metagenome]